jgi:hypothetical protein
MASRHKALVILIHEGIDDCDEEAPQDPPWAPRELRLFRRRAKQGGKDGVLGEVSGLAHSKVEDFKASLGKGQVKKSERARKHPFGEAGAKPAGRQGKDDERPHDSRHLPSD